MEELNNLIKQCCITYSGNEKCTNCVNGKRCTNVECMDCYQCIKHIHDITNKSDIYNCPNMISNYVIKHFYRFSSEIQYAFEQISKYFKEQDEISVVSIGCGPSSELYGVFNGMKNTDMENVSLDYKGFDINSIWSPIWEINQNIYSSSNINYYNQNIFDYYKDNTNEHIDLLIVNYMLSDMAKFNSESISVFLDELISFVKNTNISFVLFNDIPLFYDKLSTGYSCMEYVCRGLKDSERIKYKSIRNRFRDPNEYQPTYGTKYTTCSLKYSIIQECEAFSPFSECGSIQMIIRKLKI